MNKNFNLENAKSIIAEASGVPVNTTFGSITKPIDLLLEVIDMSADLIALIRGNRTEKAPSRLPPRS